MKKYKIHTLIAAALFSAMLLTGCSKQGAASASSADDKNTVSASSVAKDSNSISAQDTNTTAYSSEQVQPETKSSSDAQVSDHEAQQTDLNVIMEEIRTTIRPGSAGSSITAAAVTAHLLDFGASTEMSAEEIKVGASTYMNPLSGADKSEMLDQMSSVGEMLATFKNSDPRPILADAGIEDSNYPWTPSAYENANAVLQGCGL